MSLDMSRRSFCCRAGALVMTSMVPPHLFQPPFSPALLYPPADLSCFDIPISPAPAIRIGYAAITWGGRDSEAIEDIAGLGFRGIQLRENCIQEFASARELRELLDRHGLKMVALSSGNLTLDPALGTAEIGKHLQHAKFVHDLGGLYLQIIDQRPANRPATSADYRRLGSLLTEVGKRTADLGVSLGYHNHMGSLGESPEGVDRILEGSDPRYVKLELDIAHYFQGGGNPSEAIGKYRDRLLFLHIKDVEPLTSQSDSPNRYRFVELGRGKVDLPAVFSALRQIAFRGWAIVELDSVPESSRTPKDCALISKRYLETRLGLKL
ncbi:MAG: TIM barrel protein [Acidobacteria bacterium]|nr:TIM barrel protein [Acidobacteriota bacterium]